MTWGLFCFLAIGTIGAEQGAEHRWPSSAWVHRYVFALTWAVAWWATDRPTAAWISFAAAAFIVIQAVLTAPKPARRPAQHRVGQGQPYPPARPLRRIP